MLCRCFVGVVVLGRLGPRFLKLIQVLTFDYCHPICINFSVFWAVWVRVIRVRGSGFWFYVHRALYFRELKNYYFKVARMTRHRADSIDHVVVPATPNGGTLHKSAAAGASFGAWRRAKDTHQRHDTHQLS
jgi:hypothetical protein